MMKCQTFSTFSLSFRVFLLSLQLFLVLLKNSKTMKSKNFNSTNNKAMRKVLLFLLIVVPVALAIGCSSDSNDEKGIPTDGQVNIGTLQIPYRYVSPDAMPAWMILLLTDKNNFDLSYICEGKKNGEVIYLIHHFVDATAVGYFFDSEGKRLIQEVTSFEEFMAKWDWTCIYYNKSF